MGAYNFWISQGLIQLMSNAPLPGKINDEQCKKMMHMCFKQLPVVINGVTGQPENSNNYNIPCLPWIAWVPEETSRNIEYI